MQTVPVNNVDVAVAAVFVSAVLGVLAARRAAYERVIEALDLIGGEVVARARHRVGTIAFDHADELSQGSCVSLSVQDRSARIEDVFTILWAATRLNAVRRSLGPRWPRRGAAGVTRQPILGARGPHRLLVDSSGDWMRYWLKQTAWGAEQLPLIRAVAKAIDATLDEDDTVTLRELQRAWG